MRSFNRSRLFAEKGGVCAVLGSAENDAILSDSDVLLLLHLIVVMGVEDVTNLVEEEDDDDDAPPNENACECELLRNNL